MLHIIKLFQPIFMANYADQSNPQQWNPNYNNINLLNANNQVSYAQGTSLDLSNSFATNHNNQYNDNFPFGRDRERVAKKILQKMNSSVDQDNKRILQKFKIDAIRHRNQRVMKHLGKLPYLTESMLLGSSIDVSKLVQRTPNISPSQVQYIKPVNQFIPFTSNVEIRVPKEPYPVIKTPRKIKQQTQSIGVQVNFEEEFPISSKKKKQKKRLYTIEQQREQQAMDKITDLLHQINSKINKNTKNIQQHQISSHSLDKSTPRHSQWKPKQFHRNFTQMLIESDPYKLPSIEYNSKLSSKLKSLKSLKTEGGQKHSKSFLKQHLQLLKKNRKRIEDLDQYVYG